MTESSTGVLEQARQDLDMTYGELWIRYFGLGGMSTALEVEAFLFEAIRPSDHDYDVVAHALNERHVELGGDHPVPYSDELNNTHEQK